MAQELGIRGQIVRWVSDDVPGFVECRFTDRFDREWVVIEKEPILWNADLAPFLHADSPYPIKCLIAGEVVSRADIAGRATVIFDTTRPWGVETTDCVSRFEVFEDQLAPIPEWKPPNKG